jgi:hypothetical protein
MAQRAGIALSRVADNAPFVVTRVDGAPHPATVADPVEHKLEGLSVPEMMSTFERAVGFTTTSIDNGFAITYPLMLPEEQRKPLEDANRFKTFGHFHAFANYYAQHHSSTTKQERDLQVLFIDLTPGQVAAKMSIGSFHSTNWYYSGGSQGKEIALGNVDYMTTQDVVNKLINPTIGKSGTLNCIGILRPEGAFPDVSSSDLEAKFPDTLIKWVSLADLSHGIAMVMHSQLTTHDIQWTHATLISIPLGLILANGQTVTLIPAKHFLPAGAKVLVTNSKDDQTTATLRFKKGLIPCGEVVVQGLTPQPKGTARLRVIIDCDDNGQPSVTVEESGAALRTAGRLENLVTNHKSEDIDEYNNAERSLKQILPVFGQDGVIGELPE